MEMSALADSHTPNIEKDEGWEQTENGPGCNKTNEIELFDLDKELDYLLEKVDAYVLQVLEPGKPVTPTTIRLAIREWTAEDGIMAQSWVESAQDVFDRLFPDDLWQEVLARRYILTSTPATEPDAKRFKSEPKVEE